MTKTKYGRKLEKLKASRAQRMKYLASQINQCKNSAKQAAIAVKNYSNPNWLQTMAQKEIKNAEERQTRLNSRISQYQNELQQLKDNPINEEETQAA